MTTTIKLSTDEILSTFPGLIPLFIAGDWQEVEFCVDNINPESLLLIKEELDKAFDNPCFGCLVNNEDSKEVLDFCHYHCTQQSFEDGLT